jgi:orotidine-5'-phosphate decarboxylase
MSLEAPRLDASAATAPATAVAMAGERRLLIPLQKSIIPACDVEDLDTLKVLAHETAGQEGIGAFKIGMTVFFEEGLKRAVEIIRGETDKPIIVDYQKAGNDIPEMGSKFARAVKKAGAEAAILFPFTGPATQEAWTDALVEQGVLPIVGGHMTHKSFLRSEGGYIADDTPERIYTFAAESGKVKDFVVPGNKPLYVETYKTLLDGILGVDGFTLYAPGFVTQGGDLSETGKVAGNYFHGIVGGALYDAQAKSGITIGEAAKQFSDKILSIR